MSERFDDIIRKKLEGLESPVPQDMFDAIRSQPDAMFDAGLRNKLQPVESPVAGNLFDKINAAADLTNAPFDETILQKLTTYPSPVPADMWERIMQNKRRRRPVAWWVAAGLVLLLSGGTWYAVHRSNKMATGGKTVLAEKNDVPNKTSASPGNILVTKETVTPALTDTAKKVVSVTPNALTPQQDAFTKTLSPAKATVVNTNDRKRSVIQKQQNPVYIFLKDSRNKTAANHQSRKAITTDPGNNNPDLLLGSGKNKEETQEDNTLATFNALRLAISSQLRNAAKLLPGQLLKARPRLPVIPCPANGDDERSNNWYADIYTSAFMVKKNISDNGAGKNAKNGFDSTLHQQVSYNAGISIVKNMGKNILLKTGVQYNRINESFRLTRINERKLVTTISIRTVILAPGDTVYIRDTSVTETIGTIQRRKQNTYQQWDIPVIIGYEFGGEDVRLNANAGIIANIRSSYSGEMLADTSLQIIDAKNYNGKPVYKTNVGFSLYASLSIVKPLGERTSLLIEPYARIGLQNITTDNAWFKQKNTSAGITIGLRYQLNGSGQRR